MLVDSSYWFVTQWGLEPYVSQNQVVTRTLPISYADAVSDAVITASIAGPTSGNDEVWTAAYLANVNEFTLEWGYHVFDDMAWISHGLIAIT